MKSLNEIQKKMSLLEEKRDELRRLKDDILLNKNIIAVELDTVSKELISHSSRVDMRPEEKVLYDKLYNSLTSILDDMIMSE